MTRFSATEVQKILAQDGYGVVGSSSPTTPRVTAKNILMPGEHHVIQAKGSKYSNKRVAYRCATPEEESRRGKQTLVFDSIGEFRRYQELLMLEEHNIITGLELQKTFELQPAFTMPDGTDVRAITYRADFAYMEGKNEPDDYVRPVVEDFKGVETDVFKLKWKMMQYRYGNRWKLVLVTK